MVSSTILSYLIIIIIRECLKPPKSRVLNILVTERDNKIPVNDKDHEWKKGPQKWNKTKCTYENL